MRTIRKVFQLFVDKPIGNGEVLNDHYEVLKVIGTGSYGIVYLCKELKSEENRVVKQLRPSKRRDKKVVEMFENEISVLQRLNHQRIPIVYETFAHNGHLFYVMGFIEGENLEDQIFSGKKKFNEKESLLILSQLLEFIDFLHKHNIYHQDLRIPNIILQNSEIFLIDFGLAKSPISADLVHPFSGSLSDNELLEMRRQDYYDLGDILLYLLYTTYSPKGKKALPWTEELSLEVETVFLLKRLLQIDEPYSNVSEISTDLQAALLKQQKYIHSEEV
ncbi:serine/threonine protein kinase [Siminovitchia sediminis]|uniref:Serine/threonine protein kinase n=1 Tax=Siminovitchia sediminis TaxID=1274353 RepID=A0ABW4KNS3_9BACI